MCSHVTMKATLHPLPAFSGVVSSLSTAMWALWEEGLMLGSLKNVVIMKVGSYPNVLLESDEYLIIWPRSGYQL